MSKKRPGAAIVEELVGAVSTKITVGDGRHWPHRTTKIAKNNDTQKIVGKAGHGLPLVSEMDSLGLAFYSVEQTDDEITVYLRVANKAVSGKDAAAKGLVEKLELLFPVVLPVVDSADVRFTREDYQGLLKPAFVFFAEHVPALRVGNEHRARLWADHNGVCVSTCCAEATEAAVEATARAKKPYVHDRRNPVYKRQERNEFRHK
jgi:hypothetical protein